MTYLLDAVQQQAAEAGANRVLAINLRLGERAGIDDSLLYYFDMLTPGTIVEGAKLNVQRTPMRFNCPGCGKDYVPIDYTFTCPQCGHFGVLVDDGSQLIIESIEVDS